MFGEVVNKWSARGFNKQAMNGVTLVIGLVMSGETLKRLTWRENGEERVSI